MPKEYRFTVRSIVGSGRVATASRAWHTLAIYFTVLLNRQLRRGWLLEQKCMEDRPVSQRFRPFFLLEPVPTLQKPSITLTTGTTTTTKNTPSLEPLKQTVRLPRARVEKGKELASEIERRTQNPSITFPTHFCHTCVADGDEVDILLTKCGHRMCVTCLEYGFDGRGVYECSICFVPAQFVSRASVGLVRRSCLGRVAGLSRGVLSV